MHIDSFIYENLVDDLGDFGVFGGDEPVGSLDDAYLGSEPSIHLGVFAADVAAAQNDEMVGKVDEVEGGGGVEPWDFVEAGDGWDVRSGPGVDHSAFRPIASAARYDGVMVNEPGRRFNQGEVVCPDHGPVGTVADLGNHLILTGNHPGQVNSDRTDFDAELASPTGQVGDLGRVDHGLGGDTTPVQTSPTKEVLFDEDGGAVPGGPQRQGKAGHAATDHDRVGIVHGLAVSASLS
jgi:hypothetical protein